MRERDTHRGELREDGTVVALCGVTFRPRLPRGHRRCPVTCPARWAFSPLDCQVPVLADGDQTLDVLKARCGQQLPVVVAVHDHRPPGRVCFPCELIARANLDTPVTR